MGGAFQTSRDIFENPIWQNIVEFRLFFLIYGKATFIDGVRVGEITLKRGQWLRSIRNLQLDLEYKENNTKKRYSTATIARAIKRLEKDGRLVLIPWVPSFESSAQLGTVFEVVNYAKYQGFTNYINKDLTQQRNSSETAAKQQRNNNKKGKNAKKVKNNTYSVFFESVWNLYPNKKGKAQISDTKKKELQKVSFEVLQKCIDRYVRTKEEWKAYQNGSTFFNTGYVDYLDGNFEEPPKVKQKTGQKKSIKDNFEQREYPDEVLESLYKNSD